MCCQTLDFQLREDLNHGSLSSIVYDSVPNLTVLVFPVHITVSLKIPRIPVLMALACVAVHTQVRWLQTLAELEGVPEVPSFSTEATDFLDQLLDEFGTTDAQAVKDIEKITNHDVKAIEYALKTKFKVSPEPLALCFGARTCHSSVPRVDVRPSTKQHWFVLKSMQG